MDWFSWLSKTSLELSLVYDYGVVFACNELTAEDIAHFDHEFLQSMGIKVAKHRLEIIKLARSEARDKAGSVSGRVRDAIGRTKRRVVECAKKIMFHERNSKMVMNKYWRRSGGQKKEEDEGKGEVFRLTHHSHNGQWGEKSTLGYRSPRMMKSGPLERRNNGEARMISRGHSGPLDKVLRGASPSGWLPEKSKKSPVVPRGLEGGNDGIESLWAKLFQDMKPT